MMIVICPALTSIVICAGEFKCLYRLLSHPLIGLLLGDFDRLYCIFLHHRAAILKHYSLDTYIEVSFTDDFFAFPLFMVGYLLCFTFRFGMQEIQPQNGMRRLK